MALRERRRVVAPFSGQNSSLCFLDDFIGPLLLPDNLGNTVIVILNRRCSDYDGGFQAFEFARAASQPTIIGSTWKEVALLEDVISVVVGVGAKPVLFGSLGSRVYGASKLAPPCHFV